MLILQRCTAAGDRVIMDRLELYELIAGGEDSFVEFKREVSQKRAERRNLADEMVAFTNTG